MKDLVRVIAAAEGATGVAALAAPSLVSRFLLGGELSGTGVAMGRFAGIALMGLAAAGWPEPGAGPVSRPGVRGLLFYSSLVSVALAAGGITGAASGPLLWPAVAVHVVLSVLLASILRKSFNRGKR